MNTREEELLELALIVEAAIRRAESLDLELASYILAMVKLDISSMAEMTAAVGNLKKDNNIPIN